MTPPAWPCLLDGVLISDGRIGLDARGGVLSCGEGLFETLPVVSGTPCFLDRHLSRLDAACRLLGFGPGPGEAAVRAEIAAVARATGAGGFSLRIVVFRDGGRTHRLLVTSPIPEEVGRPVALGLVAPAFEGPRSLATLKTLNYLTPRLAHEEGVRRGFDEVLFRLADGTVLEGTRSSVFMIARGTIVTPPLSLPILPGVTREVILGCARKAGLAVEERPFDGAALARADEAFVSASVRGVRPVLSFESAPLPACPGPVTERVGKLYQAEILALG
jgi:branched-subunit amino acid aminotransferase/4-amino-4-deoxychorismate lyase